GRPTMISSARREDIVSALRRGTVPSSGLDALAVGIDTFAPTLDDELESVSAGRGGFKAVRGEYGTGKTFFGRWLQERARARGFAATEVQINETETPLHRLETVYRRLVEHLGTADTASGAFRGVIDGWFYALEQDVLADASVDASDAEGLLLRTNALMEARLGAISKTAPAFSAVLRTYRRALAAGDGMLADGLISWLAGQPNVAASIKRAAGIKGDLDHFGATNFLVGLLTILRDSGFSGLVMVLDEVETLQRMRTDTREKGLNALRQWIDEIDAGRYPGLYLVITGTPAFYDGPQGVQRLAPLAQRLHVDFGTDRRFDNPRAVQIRLAAFDHTSLLAVGRRVRDIYADGRPNEQRLRSVVDDSYLDALARAVAGGLGGKVGVAPRLFLKKLVSDVLDRVDLHEDFDPRKHYTLTLAETEMCATERAAASAASVDDIEL
ncbi:MAG TPA: BREX system ATP-binding protein BrxD, partial [Burkholderiaceae bacterium]|nr:BREX system ATP-binding protein BrxD [Burkholderiaceae bacterium]